MTKISDNFFVLKGLGAFWPLSGREFRLLRKRDELSQAFPPLRIDFCSVTGEGRNVTEYCLGPKTETKGPSANYHLKNGGDDLDFACLWN